MPDTDDDTRGLCVRVAERIFSGKRTVNPQREQGLLLTSHSLPQRGHVILYSSLCTNKAFSATRATGIPGLALPGTQKCIFIQNTVFFRDKKICRILI
jgi:hypothetical protein